MKKLLVALVTISGLATIANAEEISAPDITMARPQKTIDSGEPVNEKMMVGNSRPVILNSLFFKRADASVLKSAHESYRDILISRSVDKLGAPPEEELKAQAPQNTIKQIYLSSIIYGNGKDSVAWINNKKYKIGDLANDITLVSASAEKARLKFILDAYTMSDASTEALKKNPNIKLNATENSLEFSLMPNQRLDLEQMKILIGSKTYPNTNPDAQLAKAAQNLAAAVKKDEKTLKDSAKALEGLIGAMDKMQNGLAMMKEIADIGKELGAIKDPVAKTIIDKGMNAKDDAGMLQAINELKAKGKIDEAAKLQKFFNLGKKMEQDAAKAKAADAKDVKGAPAANPAAANPAQVPVPATNASPTPLKSFLPNSSAPPATTPPAAPPANPAQNQKN